MVFIGFFLLNAKHLSSQFRINLAIINHKNSALKCELSVNGFTSFRIAPKQPMLGVLCRWTLERDRKFEIGWAIKEKWLLLDLYKLKLHLEFGEVPLCCCAWFTWNLHCLFRCNSIIGLEESYCWDVIIQKLSTWQYPACLVSDDFLTLILNGPRQARFKNFEIWIVNLFLEKPNLEAWLVRTGFSYCVIFVGSNFIFLYFCLQAANQHLLICGIPSLWYITRLDLNTTLWYLEKRKRKDSLFKMVLFRSY